MNEELRWHIGKEGTPSTRLNLPPFKAFFLWVRDGELVNSADFSKDELKLEIERLQKEGKDAEKFKEAFRRLERL
jgi:hypothetical protein